MRRRELLAGLVVGGSGCLGAPAGTTPSETPGTATPRSVSGESTDPTATPPESPFPRRIAVERVADGPLRERFDVAAEVSIPDGDVTAEGTARVELALRTTGGTERTLTYEEHHCDRNEFRARTDGFGLFLLPADGDWTVGGTDCPVVGHPNVDCGIPTVEETVTVPASGAVRWQYDVLVPPRNPDRGGCVVPGRYRFTRSFAARAATAELAFTLSVTAP